MQAEQSRSQLILVTIATVLTSFGVRGEIKARVVTDFPERFKTTSEVYLEAPDGTSTKHKLESSRFHKNGILLKLSGIDTPEEVAKYRNWSVSVPQSELMPLEENEYWHFQLKGLRIVDQNQQDRGKLCEIYPYPGCDQYVVRDDFGHELMIPASQRFIKKIDLESGIMHVDLPREED